MRWAVTLVVLALLPSCLPPVGAHGDARTLTATVLLEPGQAEDFVRDVHWHRMLGTVRADPGVALHLSVAPSSRPATQQPEPVTIVDGRVDHLIACCKDATWTPFSIQVRNQGEVAAEVRLQLSFIHDDFAVLADRAEGGSGFGVLILSGLTGAAALRSRPRGVVDPTQVRRWTRWSIASIGVAWALLIGLALIGWARFGDGPLHGSLSVFAFMPLPGPLLNSHLVGMVALFALWLVALFSWSRARRWSRGDEWPHAVLAIAIIAGGPIFALFFLVEYGDLVLGAAYGLVPTLAFGSAWWLARKRRDHPDRHASAAP